MPGSFFDATKVVRLLVNTEHEQARAHESSRAGHCMDAYESTGGSTTTRCTATSSTAEEVGSVLMSSQRAIILHEHIPGLQL